MVSAGHVDTSSGPAGVHPVTEDWGHAITETPLTDVGGWSSEHIGRLRDAGVTSAEQVVALAATPGGLTSLAEQLQADEERVRGLVDRARAVLAPPTRDELERPVDTREFGLGVLPPDRD